MLKTGVHRIRCSARLVRKVKGISRYCQRPPGCAGFLVDDADVLSLRALLSLCYLKLN
jgi:hypothetical protein